METATKNLITNRVKDTVGYNEATNKVSFIAGANVGISKAAEVYEDRIKELEGALKVSEESYNDVRTDMVTLTGILNKYSDH